MNEKIKQLTEKIRQEREGGTGTAEQRGEQEPAVKITQKGEQGSEATKRKGADFQALLETIKNVQVNGGSKILFRIDEKNETFLRQLKTTFKIEQTQLLNYLINVFNNENPELKNQIIKSLKQL